MKLSKCHFFAKEIQYLGHILGMEGIRPVPAKTEAIKAMHPPVNPKQVRAFLGLVGYYRKFIKNFAKIAKPLTVLTRMDGNTLLCFHETERRHYPSTHPQIPGHNKTLYHVHRCLQRCLQSSALTDA